MYQQGAQAVHFALELRHLGLHPVTLALRRVQVGVLARRVRLSLAPQSSTSAPPRRVRRSISQRQAAGSTRGRGQDSHRGGVWHPDTLGSGRDAYR